MVIPQMCPYQKIQCQTVVKRLMDVMLYQDSDVEITDCTCTIANLCMQNTEELASDIHLGLPEKIQKCFDNSSNISNTRKSVSSDIQTLRSGLKKRGIAEFFLTNFLQIKEQGN